MLSRTTPAVARTAHRAGRGGAEVEQVSVDLDCMYALICRALPAHPRIAAARAARAARLEPPRGGATADRESHGGATPRSGAHERRGGSMSLLTSSDITGPARGRRV